MWARRQKVPKQKAKYKIHYKFKEKQQQNHLVHKQCGIVLKDV